MERAENHARIARLLLNTVAEEIEVSSLSQLLPILQTLLSEERIAEINEGGADTLSFEQWDQLLAEVISSQDNPGSLQALVKHVQRTAGSVKERLSNDTWQMLGRFQSLTTRGNARNAGVDLFGFVDETLIVLAGISGLAMENMTRGYGWIFLDLGRRMERGVNLCTLLRGSLEREVPHMDGILHKLLICADSTITYRRRYLTQMNLAPVLDLLVF
ncbi:MAG: alpha-E domain-containing protein [Verrucomicrobia bacterium]|nr:alpha-E domain-containing protein [Verrucomicrobiota bacterium]